MSQVMIDAELDLQWEVDAVDSFPPENEIRRWISSALDAVVDQPVELCVRFVSEGEMQSLNHQYRDADKSTNVLSFELGEQDEHGRLLLGDIVICCDVVSREAAEQQKRPDAHLAHMLIHGILHLQGHDHIEEEQAKEMEHLETDLLATLGFSNPYE